MPEPCGVKVKLSNILMGIFLENITQRRQDCTFGCFIFFAEVFFNSQYCGMRPG